MPRRRIAQRLVETLLPAVLVASGVVHSALARGDLLPDKDSCVLKIGPEIIYFAGYQPGAAQQKKFCEDAPQSGETIFVFDYAAPELREMKAGFRILLPSEASEDEPSSESATVAALPPQIYPKGTFSFAHVFAQPGDFVGVVTIDGAAGEHWTARFPFSVGKRRFEISPYYLIGAAGLLAFFLFVSSRSKPAGARR
ncbi:hypothetical protein [Methylosinus sporium]|uniref:hypothetical protein n=1 Tax=Methylosinus sporium TaxID=428 RepID=UPI00383BD825